MAFLPFPLDHNIIQVALANTKMDEEILLKTACPYPDMLRVCNYL